MGTSKSINIKYHSYPESRHSSLLNSRHPMYCNDSATRVELIGLWLQNSKDEILGEGRIWKVCQLHSCCNLWQWPCSRGCCLHTTNSKSNNFGNIILAFTHKFKLLSTQLSNIETILNWPSFMRMLYSHCIYAYMALGEIKVNRTFLWYDCLQRYY